MATIKVFSRLQERDFNAHGLLVKAESLVRVRKGSKRWKSTRKRSNAGIIGKQNQDLQQVLHNGPQKDHDSLEISEEQVKSVKQVPVKSEVESFLEVELDGSDTVNKVMVRKSRLMQAPVEWMRKHKYFGCARV